jgi:hypothetical protein
MLLIAAHFNEKSFLLIIVEVEKFQSVKSKLAKPKGFVSDTNTSDTTKGKRR